MLRLKELYRELCKNRLVPPRIQPVLAIRKPLKDWCAEIKRLEMRLQRLGKRPGGEKIPAREINHYLQKARLLVNLHQPFCACSCNPRDECPLCQSLRWQSVSESAQSVRAKPTLVASESSANAGPSVSLPSPEPKSAEPCSTPAA